jgi:LemA protein
MKKTGLIVVGVIVAILVMLIGWYVSTYNSIVTLEEKVETEYSNINVALERRADLIPNLVSTVKGYMAHEENIINSITEARENLVNAKTVSDKAEANEKLTSALNNLNVIVENYPDLKANTNFIQLQDELAGTENRIATARRDYNNVVKEYNTKIKTIPSSIVASMMGKTSKDYFQVENEEKTTVPQVNFN